MTDQAIKQADKLGADLEDSISRHMIVVDTSNEVRSALTGVYGFLHKELRTTYVLHGDALEGFKAAASEKLELYFNARVNNVRNGLAVPGYPVVSMKLVGLFPIIELGE